MLQFIKQFPENLDFTNKIRNEFNQYIDPTCKIINSSIGEYVDLVSAYDII